MPHRKIWAPSLIEQLITLYKEGANLKMIARDLNCTPTQLEYKIFRLKKEGRIRVSRRAPRGTSFYDKSITIHITNKMLSALQAQALTHRMHSTTYVRNLIQKDLNENVPTK